MAAVGSQIARISRATPANSATSRLRVAWSTSFVYRVASTQAKSSALPVGYSSTLKTPASERRWRLFLYSSSASPCAARHQPRFCDSTSSSRPLTSAMLVYHHSFIHLHVTMYNRIQGWCMYKRVYLKVFHMPESMYKSLRHLRASSSSYLALYSCTACSSSCYIRGRLLDG